MKKISKSLVALFLCAVMTVLGASPAFAVLEVPQWDWKSHVVAHEAQGEYIDMFNDSVNSLKTELPYSVVTYRAGVPYSDDSPENGIQAIADGVSEPLSPTAQRYIGSILDGLFSEKNSAMRSVIKTVIGANTVKADTVVLHRGAKRNELLPVFGKSFVSALKDKNDYQILLNQKAGSEIPQDMLVYFGSSVPLEQAQQSSQADLFNLPSGGIDIELVSGGDRNRKTFLDNVKIENFSVLDARAVASFDSEGVLTKYSTGITYDFTIGYVEAAKLMSAILGFDVVEMVMSSINSILEGLSQSPVSAEAVLGTRKLKITYAVSVVVSDINFAPRLFGDINDDGKVNATDARTALRVAVGLDHLKYSADLLYADVNFDGVINAADARIILRMAVGLERTFSQVPDGQSIKIVVVEEDVTPPEETPSEGEGEFLDFEGIFDFDPTLMPADLISFIFDTITNLRDAEGVFRDDIEGIRAIIQNIVRQARSH